MTGEILIFGGTTEGRQVSAFLSEKHASHTVCVATEYGEEVLEPSPFLTVHTGRMNAEEMGVFLRGRRFALIVDATHPYATEASENIRSAADAARVPYLRYSRQETKDAVPDGQETIRVRTAREAAEYLERQSGGIFLTTGSKELPVFVTGISDKSRLTVRVLPTAEALASCRDLGLTGKQICAMQGPFSTEMNIAMLRQSHAAFLVTKESGSNGGYAEKMEAAASCGVTVVVISRPEESGSGWEEVRAKIEKVLCSRPASPGDAAGMRLFKEDSLCRITCVGIGMGTPDTLTREAAQAILCAQVIFGAPRMLQCAQELLRENRENREEPPILVEEYDAEKIHSYLQDHPAYRRAVILMSGDVGFYSGAKQIAEIFHPGQVRYLCGVSSVSYFASRIPTSWQDAVLLSAHGRDTPVLNYVRRYPKIFLLVGSGKDVEQICRELDDAGMNRVRISAARDLSYPGEEIRAGGPADFCSFPSGGQVILFIENPDADAAVTPGIPDEQFERGQVPMTKEEIRIFSVSKLRLKEDSVIFDVGAGTGSVAVECARLCTRGWVYAIEKNPDAIALIRKNSRKFGVSNLTAVEGWAPEILTSLPVPTHAFIGGSSGKLSEIVDTLRRMNPAVRIVINTVTMESIAEEMQILKDPVFSDAEIVQISAAKSRNLGSCHLMTAHNPVTVLSFGGGE